MLSKQTGGAVLLPVLLLWWQARAGWGAFARLSAGALLPVASIVPGNVKGTIAVQLVLDHSGSMIDLVGEYPKIEMAQTASVAAARFLSAHEDYLGVVAFNIKPKTVVRAPLGGPEWTLPPIACSSWDRSAG